MLNKVGIVTLWYHDCNFGSTIQNWALHHYLQKKFDVDTFTIVNSRYTNSIPSQWSKDFYNFPQKTWDAFCDFKQEIKHKFFIPSEIKSNDASCFIIGGDQVLNSYNSKVFDLQYNLLHNISKDKKVLYSAGICSDQFATYKETDPNVKKCYDELKNNMHSLSFREKLKDFPQDTQYIDPTLLLTKEDYEKIEEKPDGEIPKKFDFLYFVKNTSNNPTAILTFFLKERKEKYPLITNRDDLKLGPKQIIWCINHCQNLYTNSFHGFIFSVIFNKKVILYNKYDFRIRNVINLLNIKHKNNEITNLKEVLKNIKFQQQRSFEYFDKNLRECLDLQKNEEYPRVYAAFRKDKTLRDQSTSGGLSALLAEKIFEKKGVVYGAAYAQDFRSVQHIRIDNISDYYHLIALSKYNISSLKGVFPKIKTDLDSGLLVMFTGTPCQVFVLKRYLKNDYPNLLTVDLLCHGVSKRRVLNDYISRIESNFKSKVIRLNMRHVTTTVIMENGQNFIDKDAVHRIFINEENLYNMCKNCNRHYGNNVSDITLGDFWDIEKYIPNDSVFNKINVINQGINIIKIHTLQGVKLFDTILNKVEYKRIR